MTEPAPAARIDLSGVGLAVDDRWLVRGLDLILRAGEIVAIVAPSGKGKTTLLRAIVRLADHAEGRIALDGTPISEIPGPGLRRRVALVAQRPMLLGPTVVDDLAAGARAPVPMAAADELLGELGLPAGFTARPSVDLSGGEQARVAIARALLTDPEVLLLDEPSSALDEGSTEQLSALLQRRAAEGLAILLVTHDPALLAATGARVVELPLAEEADR